LFFEDTLVGSLPIIGLMLGPVQARPLVESKPVEAQIW